MNTRRYAVLALAGFAVGCDDATEPGTLVPLHPAFATAASTVSTEWVAAAPMLIARSQHGSAMGADGRVYAFEGAGPMGPVRGSEVYDPAANAWSAIASPGGWCCGGSARGGDGRLYLVGGEWENDQSMSRVSAYDPAENTWESVQPMAVQRDVLAAIRGPDGRIYATGGLQEGLTALTLSSVEVYDPAANTWSPGVPMGQRRWFHTGALGPDNRIYVFGGLVINTPLASAEVFDPESGQWSPIAPMPATRYGSSAVTGSDGLIYLVGGVVSNGGPGTSVIAYDPGGNSWSNAPSLNIGRTQLAAALALDGHIIATGGFSPALEDNTNTVEGLGTAPVPTNQAPVAAAGEDLALECVAGGADALLNASGSSDPDQDPLTYEWREGSSVLATTALATLRFGLGAHLLTLRVTDDDGAAAADEVSVTVQDTRAPTITLKRFRSYLRHRDEQLHLVARVSAADACQSAHLNVTVTSNQAPRREWWQKKPKADWKVIPSDQGGFDVYVRAELESWKGDRVYYITAVADDPSGNNATAQTQVRVKRHW